MNFLGLETPLADRLRSSLPSGIEVLTAADLANVDETSWPAPAVYLLYDTYRVLESRHDGRAARVEQRWLVVISVRDERDAATGESPQIGAGSVAEAVILALMGWQPPGTSRPLVLGNAVRPEYPLGYFDIPLTFVAELTIKGA